MRIPLLTFLESSKKHYLSNAVIIKSPRKTITTSFILDTGSPFTILSYPDALRLQIPLENEENKEHIRIGGSTYEGFAYKRLKFIFINEDGKTVQEEFPAIILKPISKAERIYLFNIPTIIGMDFLKEKKYVLYCDAANNLSYLEKSV